MFSIAAVNTPIHEARPNVFQSVPAVFLSEVHQGLVGISLRPPVELCSVSLDLTASQRKVSHCTHPEAAAARAR